MQIQKTRNYIGFIGGLLALLGFFCPFAASQSSWAFVNYVVEHDFGAYFVSCRAFSEHSVKFFAVYLSFIVLASLAFLCAFHKTGLSLTVVPTAFFLLIALQEGPALVTISGVGFWLSIVGLVVMLFACNMLGLNQIIFPWSVFYCKKSPALARKAAKISSSRRVKAYLYEKRGYVGMVGAAVTLIGFFVPYLSVWGVSVSFYDYFIQNVLPFLAVAYILLLLGVAVAYFFRHNIFGCFLSFPYVVYYIGCITSEPAIFKEGQVGFWLTVIGVVLMFLSPYFSKFLPIPDWDPYKAPVQHVSDAHSYETLDFVGVVGAVLTMIGFFAPYVSLFGFSASLCDYFSSELSPVLAFVYIALLVGVAAAYFFRRSSLGCLLSVPFAIYLVVCIVSEPEILEVGQAGFWLTIFGIVLMLISPTITVKFPAKQS